MSKPASEAATNGTNTPLVRIRETESRGPALRGVRAGAGAAGAGKRAPPGGVERRQADRRREPRSKGSAEQATIIFRQRELQVALLNVSRNGVMLAADFMPKIGERLQIAFEGCNPTRCMVRWIRNGRIGVEFVKETILLVPADWKPTVESDRRKDAVSVPTKTQADGEPAAPRPAAKVKPPALEAAADRNPRPPRERVLWPCELAWDGGSSEARLRNISTEGAMVAGYRNLEPGTEVVLALKSAGTIAGSVRWCRAGQVGICFHHRFDVAKLLDPRKLLHASEPSRPGIVKPLYLETELDYDSPWAARREKLEPRDFS